MRPPSARAVGRGVAALAALSVYSGLFVTGVADARPRADVPGAVAPDVAVSRVDNPYVGATAYVDPEWSARAAAEPGGELVAGQPTAVWLDSVAAVEGAAVDLRDHLDGALEQGAGLIQLVLYDLPGRDCGRYAAYGDLAPDEIDRYRTEFVDRIAAILSDPAYAGLRVVTVIEPNSLPSLITHVSPRPTADPECELIAATNAYVDGIGYALATLGALPNVYNYLDIADHGWLGWIDNFRPAAELFFAAANTSGASPADVHGVIGNVAGYGVTHEPYFTVDDVVNGQPVREYSRWIDWNDYVDEVPYALAMRDELVDAGFDPGLGVLIDTSRNGWGGLARPAGPGPRTDPNSYVDGGRLDRRINTNNWCNQAGAGLGERPTAAPESGIDAYVWVKPPGESDGTGDRNDDHFEPTCDPTYSGPGADPDPTGALPDAPPARAWFSAEFQELLRNAYPPAG